MNKMNRLKRHKIKSEMPETSSREQEHDLAYYIHDRVELMHQVFSVIKAKDLKVMAPDCVRNISIDDLQELCTEELLGISSKRLCAILDGADPPTDTESSSSEQLETISLDSISSDDEVLSQHSQKSKKHKHKKHRSKNNKKQQKHKNSAPQEENAASRAGLTVLELLELQARARAIRAQLQQHNMVSTEAPDPVEETTEQHDSSDEVEIKEEPAEIVEISSEDEKPKIEDLSVKPPSPNKKSTTETLETQTKRVNDLIITVPKAKTSRKIKLNRNKTIVTASTSQTKSVDKVSEPTNNKKDNNEVIKVPDNKNNEKVESKTEKGKSKKKQKKKVKAIEKDGSDHDEITLQLSDTEKMDLLDFDRKNYDNLTTSGSEDSESSSESESDHENTKVVQKPSREKDDSEKVLSVESKISNDKTKSSERHLNEEEVQRVKDDEIADSVNLKENQKEDSQNNKNSEECKDLEVENITDAQKDKLNKRKTVEKDNMADKNVTDMHKNKEKNAENIDFDIEIVTDTHTDRENDVKSPEEANLKSNDKCLDKVSSATQNTEEQEDGELTHEEEKKPDAENPEVNSEVAQVSDDKNKKKKKKEKKSKKDKKSKKTKSDFREDGDQNFYKENGNEEENYTSNNITIDVEIVVDDEADSVAMDDDIYEILELSNDSSCYEVEGVSIFSEIPTKSEIEALSAKIDEETRDNLNKVGNEENDEELENISWRDRYLDSKKVKKVLTTANILNALRKKNKELKKKLEESKIVEDIPEESTNENVDPITSEVIEGSIDHFNTLQGSTKYVDPVQENNESGEKVTEELEVDAKRLLKMYKKLLKHNNMYKEKDKDPNKKKKKKQKKSKEKKGENVEKSV